MKLSKIYIVIFVCFTLLSCQSRKQNQTAAIDSSIFEDTRPIPEKDPRPVQEIVFLNRVKSNSDYGITSDAIKKDSHIKAFNKYALDSLKKITGWEMIITEINDNPFSSNTFMSKFGNGTPVYNIVFTVPIQIDRTVDSVAIDNRVDFTYTIPKIPKDNALKKQLEMIKTLNKGDVVIVSGSLTHFDDDGKINFASFYDSYVPWNVDLLLTDIRKSPINNYSYIKHF